MDFMSDTLRDGRRFRTFNVLDDYNREALAVDCLLYTSDAADERSSVDLGGRRILKKKNNENERKREVG